MAEKRLVFDLPNHPRRGKQHIVVELPSSDSVWYLVLEKGKAKPLTGFKKPPKSAKEVLDQFAKEYGQDNVVQFMMQGYSLCD